MWITISKKYVEGKENANSPRYSEDLFQQTLAREMITKYRNIEERAISLFKENDFMFRWTERDDNGYIIGSASGGIEPLTEIEKKIASVSTGVLERIMPGEFLLPQEASLYLATLCNYIQGKQGLLNFYPSNKIASILLKNPKSDLIKHIKDYKMQKPFWLQGEVRPLKYYEVNAAYCAARLFEMVNLSLQEEISLEEASVPLMQIYEYVYDKWKIGERKLFGKKLGI